MRLADMIALAKYAHDNDLVNTAGWKWAKKKTKNPKKFVRLTKIFRSQVSLPRRYKFGIRVPANQAEAIAFDKANGNTLWQDAIDKEISQLLEYETFEIKDSGETALGKVCCWRPCDQSTEGRSVFRCSGS